MNDAYSSLHVHYWSTYMYMCPYNTLYVCTTCGQFVCNRDSEDELLLHVHVHGGTF